MAEALISPMSLEAQDHAPSVLKNPTQETNSSPQDKELEALLIASVPPQVIARILEAIQKRSSDPLACVSPLGTQY